MTDDSMSLDQKYLQDGEQGDFFKRNVIDADLNKAVECLIKYMQLTGILSSETIPLMDMVVEKLKQESIQG